jgi:beta-glucanase (GH16 family)
MSQSRQCCIQLVILFFAIAAVGIYGQPADLVAPPIFSTTHALNGAVILQITSATPGAKIHYTIDDSIPTHDSQVYEAPFLVAANITVKAVAFDESKPGSAPLQSVIKSKSFILNVPSNALIWSDEFSNNTGVPIEPNPAIWGYDTGHGGFGNHELETYCAFGSTTPPCDAASPNAFVGTDGFLHIVARQPLPGVFTSARLKTADLLSFQYGRIEFKARVPEGQGLWPAAWLLGNNYASVRWPACGEQDVLERVNEAKDPDWNEGSIHGIGFVGDKGIGTVYKFPKGDVAAEWHNYGMIWKKGSVAFYVDDPSHPYAVNTPEDLKKFPGSVWPFDAGQANYIILNLAVGGDWPGSPNASTKFPAEMQVDYVRIYSN